MQLLSGLMAGLTATAIVAAAAGGASVDLAIGGRASANPSIAASGQFVAVAWGAATRDGTTDVFVAVSRDAGRTFRAPVRVNDVVGDARLSGEQPPRVSLVRACRPRSVDRRRVDLEGQNGTRLLHARSDDSGTSFSRATTMPGGDAAGNRGWESTATDRDGHVVAVWLDHREVVGRHARLRPCTTRDRSTSGIRRPPTGFRRRSSPSCISRGSMQPAILVH